jgi:hypothetical protein
MAELAGDGFLMIELRDLSVPEWRKWLERNHASEGGAWPWAAYLALSPSRREQYARWLAAARREPTKAKRLARVAEMLEKGDRRAMIY